MPPGYNASAREKFTKAMLSVLIVNWNTWDFLRACLESLRRFPPDEPMEIVVVDNASADGSAERVREHFPEVRLLAETDNHGYAKGNNLAYAASSGEWVLTLNPDTEVLEDTLQSALETLRAFPKIGALGARQIGPDGRTQRSIRGFPNFWGIFGDLTRLGRLFPRSPLGSYRLTAFDYERLQPAPQPMGTFLLFRREAMPPGPPFDERFPIFFNEVDLLYRMREAGWETLYAPQVRLLHHGGESTKLVRKSMIWESHRSLVRFLQKHHQTRWNAPAIGLLSGLIYLAAFVRAKGTHAGFRA